MQHWRLHSASSGNQLSDVSAPDQPSDAAVRTNYHYHYHKANRNAVKSQCSLYQRCGHRSNRFSQIWTRFAKSVSLSLYSSQHVGEPASATEKSFAITESPQILSVSCVNELSSPFDSAAQFAMSASLHSHYLSSASTGLDSIDPPTYETIAAAYEPLQQPEPEPEPEPELDTALRRNSKNRFQSKTLDRKSRRSRKIDNLFSWLNRRFHSGVLHGGNWQPESGTGTGTETESNLDRCRSGTLTQSTDHNGNQETLDRSSTEALGPPPAVLRSQSCVEPRAKTPSQTGSKLKLLFCVPDGDVYESVAYGRNESARAAAAAASASASAGGGGGGDAESEMGIYATIAFPRCVTFTPSQRVALSLTTNSRKLPDLPATLPSRHMSSSSSASIVHDEIDAEGEPEENRNCDDVEPYGELDLCKLATCFDLLDAPSDSRPASLIVDRSRLHFDNAVDLDAEARLRLLMAFRQPHVSASSRSSSSGRFSASASPCSPEPLADDINLPTTRKLFVQAAQNGIGVGVYSSIRRQCSHSNCTSPPPPAPLQKPPPLPRRMYRDEELSVCGLSQVTALDDAERQRDTMARIATERIYESLSNLNADENAALKKREDERSRAAPRSASSASSGQGELSSDEDGDGDGDGDGDELPHRYPLAELAHYARPIAPSYATIRYDNTALARRRERTNGVMLDELEQLRHIDSDAESVYSVDGVLYERAIMAARASSPCTPLVCHTARHVAMRSQSGRSSPPSHLRRVLLRHSATPPRVSTTVAQPHAAS